VKVKNHFCGSPDAHFVINRFEPSSSARRSGADITDYEKRAF